MCGEWTPEWLAEFSGLAAHLLDDLDAARMVLGRAGFPGRRAPQGVANAEVFWHKVTVELEKGADPGLCPLLQLFLGRFPRNRDLWTLAKAVGHRPGRDPLAAYTERVADTLVGMSSVGAVADALGVEGFHQDEALRLAVAERIYAPEVKLVDVAGAFHGSPVVGDVGVEIADRVFPFKETVPKAAAEALAPLIRLPDPVPDPGGRRPGGDALVLAAGVIPAAVVRARKKPFAFWHVIAASCRSDRTALPTTVDPGYESESADAESALVAAIRRELLEIAGHPTGMPDEPPPEELDESLARIEHMEGRRIAVLLSPWDPELVRRLRKEYPRVVFLVVAASGPPHDGPADPADDLIRLEPIPDPADENTFYWYYTAMTGRPPRSSAPRGPWARSAP